MACLADDAPPLETVLGDIEREVANKNIPMVSMSLIERRDYTINCNW